MRIIDHHLHPVASREDGYSIEVFNALGETIAMTSVPESGLELLQRDDVFSVRRVATAA